MDRQDMANEKIHTNIKKLVNGTTLKLVRGEKTLIEIDGDFVGQVFDVIKSVDDRNTLLEEEHLNEKNELCKIFKVK